MLFKMLVDPLHGVPVVWFIIIARWLKSYHLAIQTATKKHTAMINATVANRAQKKMNLIARPISRIASSIIR